MIKGSCLCGDVCFETVAEPSGASMCHCSQCRKQSGGIWASAQVRDVDLVITGSVRWFEATSLAKRGVCPRCGSFLFWKGTAEDTISFALGAVDGNTGLSVEKHIFTASKGDYYEIAGNVPQED